MNLRFATLKALVFAGLVAAFCLVTKAQSNTEQSILFSTPDGQSISNALLPSARAPGTPQGLPDLPENEQSFSFNPQARPRMPLPQPMLKQRNKSQDDNTDIRKSMGVQTPAEAMGVPSLQELFGLPKPKATNSMSQYGGGDTGTTNILSSDSKSSDANWAKILSADSDAFNMAKTADSNRLTGALFDSATSDNLFRSKKADDEKADDDFNTSSFARANGRQPGQGAWEAAVQIAAPANVPGYTPPAPAPSGFGASSLNSQSPFALPKAGTPETSIPHLPTLPGASSWQNSPSQPATPSWAPKPPPWLDSTPPMGTMAQRKF